MAELRVREIVTGKDGKPVKLYVKTKSRAARQAAFKKQLGKKAVKAVASK